MSKFETALHAILEAQETQLGRDLDSDEIGRLEGELFDRWIAERRFDDLVRHVQEAYEDEGGLTDLVLLASALRHAGDVERTHALFRGLVASRSRGFWRSWPKAATGHIGHMRDAAKHAAATMEALAEYFLALMSLGLAAEAEAVRADMRRLQAREKSPAAPRPRTASAAPAFWDIVDAARADAGSAGHFAANLDAALEPLTPAQRKAFVAQADAALAAVAHWDLWAFAFLARGGCSDDAFDYFRAWLVAQGRAVHAAACAGPDALLAVFEPVWDCECEELLAVLEPLRAATMSRSRPAPVAGTRWTEEELAARYPVLHAHFAAG